MTDPLRLAEDNRVCLDGNFCRCGEASEKRSVSIGGLEDDPEAEIAASIGRWVAADAGCGTAAVCGAGPAAAAMGSGLA